MFFLLYQHLFVQLLNLVIKGAFDKYIGVFKPYLLAALDNHEDSQVCIAAVGAVAELCKAFEVKISPIMDEIMAELFATGTYILF